MKSTVLIAALVAGVSLTAFDVNASERSKMPDFATLDTDGSGTLTVAELEAAHAARFATMDTDENREISQEEFAQAARKHDGKRGRGGKGHGDRC